MPQKDRTQESLKSLVTRARTIDIRPYEDRPVRDAIYQLVPDACQVMAFSIEIIEGILKNHEPAGDDNGPAQPVELPQDSGTFYLAVDNLVVSSAARHHVADLSFMGRLELKRKLQQVERLLPEGQPTRILPWKASTSAVTENNTISLEKVLTLCSGARRKVLKIATAIENAYANAHEFEPILDHETELELALQIRYAYARLRRSIAIGESNEHNVKDNLTRAATAIARLIGRDIYPDIRISDRIELRCLQGKILIWMSESETDLTAGLHLWQDISAFVRLIQEVNRRVELIDNDSEVVEEAWKIIHTEGNDYDRFPSEIWTRLKTLYGRDEGIESLIDSGNDRIADWRQTLRKVRPSKPPTTEINANFFEQSFAATV